MHARILIVDDEPEVLSIVVEAMEADGHAVTAVCDGLAALEKFAEASYDVVITDLVMPGISGLDVAESVKRTNPSTSVILLTAWAETAERARMGESPVDATVAKPFEVDDLRARATSALRQASASDVKASIQDSVQKVESGSELVNKSGQQLEEIVSAVKQVTDIVTEIAGATREQASGIDRVNRAVSQMDGVVQSNATRTQELTTTARALATQAQELRSLVEQFKVERGADRGRVTSPLLTPTVAGRLDPERRPALKPSRVADGVLLGTGDGSVHANGGPGAEF